MADSTASPRSKPAAAVPPQSASPFDPLTLGMWAIFLALSLAALYIMLPGYLVNKDSRPGALHFSKENYAAALPHFERLTKRVPKAADYWVKLGKCQLATDQPEAALESFKQAAQVSPTAKLDREFGMAYAALKQYEMAAPYLERVLKASPYDASANFYQGLIFFDDGRYQQAAIAFAAAAKDKHLNERAAPYREQIAQRVLGTDALTTATQQPAPPAN